MLLVAGAVIRIPDPRVRPRHKAKWHICVCPERRFFLRINSTVLWLPHHSLSVAENAFLEHDSYVELTALHFFTEGELRKAKQIGRMTADQMGDVALSAMKAVTLSPEHKAIIADNLSASV